MQGQGLNYITCSACLFRSRSGLDFVDVIGVESLYMGALPEQL